MVVDPRRERRRARVLRPLGILITVVGAALLLVGVFLLATNPLGAFDVFWLPFVGGFLLFPGIFMWVIGNLSRESARFASTTLPSIERRFGGASPTRACPNCGNANPMSAQACQVCGTSLA